MTDNQTEKQKVQEITDKDVELTMMDAQKVQIPAHLTTHSAKS